MATAGAGAQLAGVLGVIAIGLGSVVAKKAAVDAQAHRSVEAFVNLAERKLNTAQSLTAGFAVAPTSGARIKRARAFMESMHKLVLAAKNLPNIL
jgi:hypothetical protein